MGEMNFIHPTAHIGENCKLGRFVIIEEDVKVYDDCVLGDYVKLSRGTVVGKGCYLDDYVNTSGYCCIEKNVTIKRCTMIGQATHIEPNVWVGSNVCTTRIKYPTIEEKEEWVVFKEGSIVGSRALILAGVTVGKGAIIGAGATVTKDCEPNGIYVGCPARLTRYRSDSIPLLTKMLSLVGAAG